MFYVMKIDQNGSNRKRMIIHFLSCSLHLNIWKTKRYVCTHSFSVWLSTIPKMIVVELFLARRQTACLSRKSKASFIWRMSKRKRVDTRHVLSLRNIIRNDLAVRQVDWKQKKRTENNWVKMCVFLFCFVFCICLIVVDDNEKKFGHGNVMDWKCAKIRIVSFLCAENKKKGIGEVNFSNSLNENLILFLMICDAS